MSIQQELLSLFLSLIERQESEILDFKKDAYNLSNEEKKLEFVKDIVCMYNTPRKENSHIILGVKKSSRGTYTLAGLDANTNSQHLDLSDLQALFLEKFRTEPFPEFKIDILNYEGMDFGIITIPPKKIGPCKFVKSHGEKIKIGNHIYFRRGSSNDLTRTPDRVRASQSGLTQGLRRI